MFLLSVFIGICLTVCTFSLIDWNRRTGAMSKWYHWVLVALWTILAMGSLGLIGTSLAAGEPKGALRGGFAFGMTAIITGVGLWRWLILDARKQSAQAAKKVA